MKLTRSARGVMVNFDQLIETSKIKKSAQPKTDEVRAAARAVKEKQLVGYVPPPPASKSPIEMAAVRVKKKKS